MSPFVSPCGVYVIVHRTVYFINNLQINLCVFLSDKLVQTGNSASFIHTVAQAEAGSKSSHTTKDSHSLGEDSKTRDPTTLLLCQHSACVCSNYQCAWKAKPSPIPPPTLRMALHLTLWQVDFGMEHLDPFTTSGFLIHIFHRVFNPHPPPTRTPKWNTPTIAMKLSSSAPMSNE